MLRLMFFLWYIVFTSILQLWHVIELQEIPKCGSGNVHCRPVTCAGEGGL